MGHSFFAMGTPYDVEEVYFGGVVIIIFGGYKLTIRVHKGSFNTIRQMESFDDEEDENTDDDCEEEV